MHAHNWRLTSYERGISKGICLTCRAEHYFSDSVREIEFLSRAEELNKLYAKEGNLMSITIERSKPENIEANLPHLPPVPPRPDTNNPHILKKYYEANKEAILADRDKLGEALTRKRWRISSSGMAKIMRRWLGVSEPTPDVTQKPESVSEKPEFVTETPEIVLPKPHPLEEIREERKAEAHPNGHNRLPPFPEFGDQWPESVQLTWMEIYRELARSEREKVTA